MAPDRGDRSRQHCVICLDRIRSRKHGCKIIPCGHNAFHFASCLRVWIMNTRPDALCPLCKVPIESVLYRILNDDQYREFQVKAPMVPTDDDQNDMGKSVIDSVRHQTTTTTPSIRGYKRRKYISDHKLRVLHIGSNRFSRYREISKSWLIRSKLTSAAPHTMREDTELTSRASAFLRRELLVYPYLDPGQAEFLRHYILSILKTVDVQSSSAESLIAEFIGVEDAQHLCHELHGFLRSGMSIRMYDSSPLVQYSDTQLPPLE